MAECVHLPPYRLSFPTVPLSDGVDWGVSSYGIPALWKQTKGEGVTVAVVDSGVAPHFALKDVVVDYRNFTSDADVYDTNGHGCIAPDDEVYTSACGVQKISDVFARVDGVVHNLPDGSVIKDVSRLGIYTLGYDPDTQATVRRKVLAVHKLSHKGDVVRVRTSETELRFTPWHPVYVQTSQRGDDRSVVKLRADELQVGQRIVLTRTNDGVYSDTHQIPMSTRWVCRYCGYEAKKGARTQCRQCNKCAWHDGPISRSLPLDEEMAYFLGLIASDGSVMRSSQTVGFYNNNRLLANEFSDVCMRLFGKRPAERPPREAAPTLISQLLHSCDAWDLCQRLGIRPNKSLDLEFPELIAKSSPGVILSFIAGVIEGDGSVCKRTGRIRIATGSERFADRLVSVCRFLGHHASKSAAQPSKTGFRTERCSWCVRIGHSDALAKRLRVKKVTAPAQQKDRRASTIKEISSEPHDGVMYDFTVEGSHNYAANGLIVSNTHVAGVIGARAGAAKGIAPECKILALKALGHSGMGSTAAVATAVRHAVEAKSDIVCMSLGSPRPDDQLHAAIRDANKAGVIVVCAAGNDGGAVNYPAAFAETIGVGAVDKHGNACEFSSRGKEIVVAAPGEDITSTWLADGYATISGTSMAAPFVAGLLALYVSHQKREGRQTDHSKVIKALAETCRDAGASGHDHIYGWGLLDPHKLLNYTVQASRDGVTIFIPGAKIL
jgi:hypothetical protein